MIAAQTSERISRLLSLVDKEATHLQQVCERLFACREEITGAWLGEKLADGTGFDQLESFSGKFARLQDTLGDKLLPTYLAAVLEPVGTGIDNLNRAEKLGLIEDAERWAGLRQLRNRLVHEYVDDLSELASALHEAREGVGDLLHAARRIRQRAEKLGVA